MRTAWLTGVLLVGLWAVAEELPAPWEAQDIGGRSHGTATLTEGLLTVTTASGDVWGTADSFRFVYQRLSGDGEIRAKVTRLDKSNDWAKAGVMIRAGLEPGAAHAFCCVTPEFGICLQHRPSQGAESDTTEPSQRPHQAPYWVKLVRRGDTFTASCAARELDWEQVEELHLTMPAEVLIGVAVASHDERQATTAEFDHLTLKRR